MFVFLKKGQNGEKEKTQGGIIQSEGELMQQITPFVAKFQHIEP